MPWVSILIPFSCYNVKGPFMIARYRNFCRLPAWVQFIIISYHPPSFLISLNQPRTNRNGSNPPLQVKELEDKLIKSREGVTLVNPEERKIVDVLM